ncbi:hypothetical protein [Enterococcus sp. DIV1420a]|uniref:hypothetical protein n=1 Tax=Enterococcus TaxID=1350 RepID=UPI003F1EB56F
MDQSQLFKSIKKSLRISFNGFDEELKELIDEGQSYLCSKAGSLPFEETDTSDLGNQARSLLKAYCKYYWNDNGHLFDKDFCSKILELQIEAVKVRRNR